MKESDWKIFKVIKENAIQLFCDKALSEYEELIKNKSNDAHGTYTDLYQMVIKRDKQMALLFDGHSRSKASLQLLAIRSKDLADDDLLKKLSDEFFKQTDPSQINW